MNGPLAFLCEHRERLELDRFPIGQEPSYVLLTPRFRASSHVLYLVLEEGRADPALVVKIPRLAGADASLRREAECLRKLHSFRPGGFDSLPKLVAFEEFADRSLLVETALVGRPLDPPSLRRRFASSLESVTTWLREISPHSLPTQPADWFDRLVSRPIEDFETIVPVSTDERRALDETRRIVLPLKRLPLPLVIEHGDLSSPNVMQLRDGRIGVVDWESADTRGLPAADLFFFLTYAAFARQRARTASRQVAAFHAAFFEPPAWARNYVLDYARRLQLPVEALTPLFVLGWLRYVVSLLHRLTDETKGQGMLDDTTTDWLRQNRYYLLWRHTVNEAHRLDWRST